MTLAQSRGPDPEWPPGQAARTKVPSPFAMRPLSLDSDSSQPRNDDGSARRPAGEPEGGVGQPQGKSLGGEGELANRPGELNPPGRGTSLRPEPPGGRPLVNGETISLESESYDLIMGNGQQTCALVSGDHMVDGRLDFDAIQRAGE